MDVGEKLVELIVEASHECDDFYDLWDMRQCAEEIASFMIAHGVTVQECGSWIDSCEYACLHKCSACGGNAPEDLESGLDTKTNYCPHCGAKMMPQTPKGE